MSEDEIPSDVDLSDPYFAEELGKTGELRQVTSGIKMPFSLHNEPKKGRGGMFRVNFSNSDFWDIFFFFFCGVLVSCQFDNRFILSMIWGVKI